MLIEIGRWEAMSYIRLIKFFSKSKFFGWHFKYICRHTYVCAINLDCTARSGNRDLEGMLACKGETMTGVSVVATRRCAV